jgi:hypothetical protein
MALKISSNIFVLTMIVVTYGCEPSHIGARIGRWFACASSFRVLFNWYH